MWEKDLIKSTEPTKGSRKIFATAPMKDKFLEASQKEWQFFQVNVKYPESLDKHFIHYNYTFTIKFRGATASLFYFKGTMDAERSE